MVRCPVQNVVVCLWRSDALLTPPIEGFGLYILRRHSANVLNTAAVSEDTRKAMMGHNVNSKVFVSLRVAWTLVCLLTHLQISLLTGRLYIQDDRSGYGSFDH